MYNHCSISFKLDRRRIFCRRCRDTENRYTTAVQDCLDTFQCVSCKHVHSHAIMGIFACETALLYYSTINGRETLNVAIISSAKSIFDALSLYSYLKYSWLRAESIVDQVFPKLYLYVVVLVKVSPFLFLLEVGSLAATIPFFQKKAIFNNLKLVCQGTSALIALIIISVDIVCLTTFQKFLHKTKQENEAVDERFRIICRHGIAANCLCLLSFVFYVFFLFLELERWLLIVYVHFFLISLILFRMKWALHEEKKRKGIERSSRIKSLKEHSFDVSVTTDIRSQTRDKSYRKGSMNSRQE
ncbi:hypothetical protein BCR33DRAFT_218704 [Rhizoclosmatium globosum]|uniref:Uncharacterized protein n=1 Tax=Rhizoclosmatium globosum TaxID=329046 RepID=A0A1Y2CB80_9FUNG|nr:hypothetical protein BCR33DRAFT_218704 [Rhizoclosmatium globosum]|eukprot:ORY44292.1 hypothetical protein BCR33DRAFT_218704 [Rhizoclosmatium globosum]